MNGRILVINNGSTSTKTALYDSESKILEKNITVDAAAAKYGSVMDRREDSVKAVLSFLRDENVDIATIDIVMARGGLITPVSFGVYAVGDAMIRELLAGRNGVHACNLSAIIASDIALEINTLRLSRGIQPTCAAYIADPPFASDFPPEHRLSGRPEFMRRSVYHALNSRAVVLSYAKRTGRKPEDLVAIVAHIGGGSSVSLHEHGKVTDVNDSLGGDGPISVERAGTVPAFPIIDICFSGKYTKEEVQKMLVGSGGAMSYFGTKDIRSLVDRAKAGDKAVEIFLRAYCASVAKYIGYFSTDVCGQVDVIIITGGVAWNSYITDEIARRVSFIAPVEVIPGENEIEALAACGYRILSGEAEARTYCPDEDGPEDSDELYRGLTYAGDTGDDTASSTSIKSLKDLLNRQLRKLPRSPLNPKAVADAIKLRRTVARGFRGDPLWRLFRRPAQDVGPEPRTGEETKDQAGAQRD